MLQAIRVTGNSRDNLIQYNLVGNAKRQPLDIPKGTAVEQGNVKVL